MKKIFSIALVFALALSVVSTASAQTMTNAFSTNLKLGSRGAAVVALQSFLEAKGLLTMPAGVAKGYFGGLTKSAVVAYQISRGVVPASGYFGPLTQASANADTGVTVPTTTTCPAGFTCTANPGTTPVVNNTGAEGVVDVKIATSPVNDTNIRTQNDVPVYGIEFRGRIADVSVQTLDLQVAVTNSSATENPSTLINTIKVWDGSTVLATLPVNSSTFVKDSQNRYYVRLSGLNFVVPVGTTKVLTVSFSTNSIDSTRNVTVNPYIMGNNIRTVSGNGISSFYTLTDSRIHAFVKPGTSVLSTSAVSSPLRSQNYRVSSTTNSTGVTLLNFTARATEGDSKIVTVYASTTGSPTAVELFDGSTKIGSATVVSPNTVIFTNVDSIVSMNSTKTYTVKANYAAGTTGSSSVTIKKVDFETPNGNTGTVTSTVAGDPVYFYVAVAKFAVGANPTPVPTNVGTNNASTSYVEAVFPITITTDTDGALLTKPVPADFTVYAVNTVSNATTTATVVDVTVPNNNIADGSVVNASVRVRLDAANAAAGVNGYRFAFASIKWQVVGESQVTQTWGLEDFISTGITFVK